MFAESTMTNKKPQAMKAIKKLIAVLIENMPEDISTKHLFITSVIFSVISIIIYFAIPSYIILTIIFNIPLLVWFICLIISIYVTIENKAIYNKF